MKRTEEDWAELIQAYRASEEGMKSFCDDAGITVSNLKYWMYKRRIVGGSKRTRPKPETKKASFISVVLPKDPKQSGIQLEIGGVSVTVEKGFDKALLLEVVEALAG